jgi:NAD(P)H-hydrate repair Nnr-like enzyme with NAD(P)H-hydrate dehydratase domain/NAD(P)H-hydrate repair Nnr-like enzyme with NAD(P)H-hydrate epimerase domain
MRTAYSVETVRAAERALMARLPDGALMLRAAAGLAATCGDLLGRVYGARVVLLVGSGDNGGDALYAGARLARRGAGVTAVLLAPGRTHPGGLAALQRAGGRTVDAPAGDSGGTAASRTLGGLAGARAVGVSGASSDQGGSGGLGGPGGPGEPAERVIRHADLVVDGIVGIGGRGGLRPVAARLARLARESGAVVVAVDLPSGVEADTGEVKGAAVDADATVTFGTYKPGLLVDPAAERTGALRLIDIGLGPLLPSVPDLEALQHTDVAALLPVPRPESDKYRRGVVGVVAGSARYPGAAVLAVAGALRGGAGAVRYVGPTADAVIDGFPETLVHAGPPAKAGRVQAWVVGPGLGDGPEARQALEDVLDSGVPVLVDADGLRLLDRESLRARSAPTVLTPHAGEAAALLGVSREEVEGARLDSVQRLAAQYGATVLLKGSTTLVATPPDPAPGSAAPAPAPHSARAVRRTGEVRDDAGAPPDPDPRGRVPVRVNPTGTAWLATAGSGDVLSGLAGSLLAAGLPARDAASVAAYLHGLAGRHAAGRQGSPVSAADVAEALGPVWRDIRADSPWE